MARLGARARVARAQRSSRSSRRTTTRITSAALDVLARELGAAGLGARADRRAARAGDARARRRAGSPTATRSSSTGRATSRGACCTRRGMRPGTSASSRSGRAPSSSATWSRASGRSSSRRATATWRCTSSSSSGSRRSMRRVALPAHGEPIDEPTRALSQVHRAPPGARGEGARRAVQLRGADGRRRRGARARWPTRTRPAHLWPIAKLSLETHLEKLEREGRVVRSPRGRRPRGTGGDLPGGVGSRACGSVASSP